MDIVAGLVYPLIAATIVGMIGFAIKRPVAFTRSSWALSAAGFAAALGFMIWQGAYERGANAMRAHIANGGSPDNFQATYFSPYAPVVLMLVWFLAIWGLESLGRYLADTEKEN